MSRTSRLLLWVTLVPGLGAIALGIWSTYRPIGGLLVLSGDRGHIDVAKLALRAPSDGPKLGLEADRLLLFGAFDAKLDDVTNTLSYDSFGLSLYRGFRHRVALGNALAPIHLESGRHDVEIGPSGAELDWASDGPRPSLRPGELELGMAHGDLAWKARVGAIGGPSLEVADDLTLFYDHGGVTTWPSELFGGP